MEKLTREQLFGLEKYSEIRNEHRLMVMEHKKNRQVSVGPNATLYFEDRVTMQYQVQEMLRAERIFDAEGIQEELDAYNPLIPNGSNWKATFMLEYADVEERQRELTKLIGIDRKTWVQVEGFDKVYPVTNEDLERETEEKTSAVHFMRFELDADMVAAVKEGTAINAGIEHSHYTHSITPIAGNIRDSLAGDLA